MTTRTLRLLVAALCGSATILVGEAFAQTPKPIRNGDVLTGELRVMRSRAQGKRIETYQVLSEARRIPGPDGMCNLETGPETFQIVTHDPADIGKLKPYIGKNISIKASDMSCASVAGQVSDALISKWSIVQ
ncbi:hypothetical protein [Afipia sp. P52-10]|uniref:hypothetical protein n=1 Tax=Afipia sp. P52-10 TaxID=1429916 RepID=UPI0005593067|nr:hypothetical protein [Afipia sp. P52-10]